jgi:hypothetical protein
MIIEFDFSKTDLIDFNFAVLKLEKKDKKWEKLAYYALGIILILVGLIGKQIIWSILGSLILISSVFTYKDLRKSIINSVEKLEKQKKLDSFIGLKKIEIKEQGLVITDGSGEIEYKWEDITSIEKIDRFLIIQIKEINLPIPTNIKDILDFENQVKIRVKNKYGA